MIFKKGEKLDPIQKGSLPARITIKKDFLSVPKGKNIFLNIFHHSGETGYLTHAEKRLL